MPERVVQAVERLRGMVDGAEEVLSDGDRDWALVLLARAADGLYRLRQVAPGGAPGGRRGSRSS